MASSSDFTGIEEGKSLVKRPNANQPLTVSKDADLDPLGVYNKKSLTIKSDPVTSNNFWKYVFIMFGTIVVFIFLFSTLSVGGDRDDTNEIFPNVEDLEVREDFPSPKTVIKEVRKAQPATITQEVKPTQPQKPQQQPIVKEVKKEATPTEQKEKKEQTPPKEIVKNSKQEQLGPKSYLYQPELMTIDDYQSDFMSDNSNERRKAVRDAFIHAFKGYENVWGKDEYKPISKGYHNWIASSKGFGMTLIDSLDTMVIMGLKEQYEKSLNYVKNDMPSFSTINGGISVFETTIRVVGGFVSAYDLTKEKVFLEKAKDMADRLLPAFNSPTGIPYSEINLKTGAKKTFSWANNCAILSELGSLQLEFRRLSEMTGDKRYHDVVTKVMDIMESKKPDNGLYPLKISPTSGGWCTNYVSLGALGDSFFEYLLKQWLLNRGTKAAERYRRMYMSTLKGIFENLVIKSNQGYTYVAEFEGKAHHKVDHLACFAAGMFALGGYFNVSTPGFQISNKHQIETGAEFTRTCYETYAQMPSGIGPETFHFDPSSGKFNPGVATYLLRPETVESIFILYRVTGDEKYREWGWKIFQAIESKCKIASGGYSGIRNVATSSAVHDDFQQSFFLAETLKYLYLLFSPKHIIPIDKFVFNTEAHPIRVTPTNH